MKTSRQKKVVIRLLSALMILFALPSAVWAVGNELNPRLHASVTFVPDSGYFRIRFPYSYRPTQLTENNLDHDLYFVSPSYIEATWNNRTVRLVDLLGKEDSRQMTASNYVQNSNEGWLELKGSLPTAGGTVVYNQSASRGTVLYATVLYYPPEGALGFNPSFNFHFLVEEDEDGSHAAEQTALLQDVQLSPNGLANITPNNLSLTTALSETTGKVDLTLSYTGTSLPKNLYWGTGTSATAFQDVSTLTQQRNCPASETTYNETASLHFSKYVTKNVTVSAIQKGYPALSGLTATYSNDGKVTLRWGQAANTGTLLSGTMYIERATTANFSDRRTISTADIDGLAGSVSYTYVDDLVDAGITKSPVYYRITRSNTVNSWGYGWGVSTSVSPTYKHVEITGASADLITQDDNTQAIRVRWTSTGLGFIWSTGSQFVLERYNATAKVTQTIPGLTKDDIASGEYIDEAIQICNRYIYTVYVQPGNSTFFEKKSFATTDITPTAMGRLKTLDASKGYFSDHIQIDWTTRGDFNQFYIQRCLHGDTAWQTISMPSGSSIVTSYTTDDNSAQAGYAYDYRLYGTVQCDDSTLVSDTLYTTGFRMPTGDFYGRVTFDNGQSEDSVEVRLESDDVLGNKALHLDAAAYATTPLASALTGSGSFTLQTWVKPDALAAADLLRMGDRTALAIDAQGRPVMRLTSGQTFTARDTFALSTAAWHHLTLVWADSVRTARLYLDGQEVLSRTLTADLPLLTDATLYMADGLAGCLDEVRVWSRALGAREVSLDYGRFIIGNKKGLTALYQFSFMVDESFFDVSYSVSGYNKRHGSVHGTAALTDDSPSNDLLAYRALTGEESSGTYSIRAVPYYGNGTAYALIPRKGTHSFSPTQEIRYINASAQSHTVNFTDNSSFEVSGKVVYQGGTFPVKDCYFTIDGAVAMNRNGSRIQTGADGSFVINVPVGTHEVIVHKTGHTFVNEGRITTSDGQDRNYQDILSGLVLEDATRITYAGRICGGAVEEAKEVGFGISKNNLADDMVLTLQTTHPEYKLDSLGHTFTFAHPMLTSERLRGAYRGDSTRVTYGEETIVIRPDNRTGEFFAQVYPEEYTIHITVNGHPDVTGDGSVLDLKDAVALLKDTLTYQDSVPNTDSGRPGVMRLQQFTDSAHYHKKQIFTKRYRAMIEVKQCTESGVTYDGYGEASVTTTFVSGGTKKTKLYNGQTDTYTLGLPVYKQGSTYYFHYDVFEEFKYYTDNLGHFDPAKTDRVPTDDAVVSFASQHFAQSDSLMEEKQMWRVVIGEPDLTTSAGQISATFTYGPSENPTSVNWEDPLGNVNGEAYILGSHATGTNFVTQGPNKILTVLRDPPGSNSYSYLEQGTTFTESSTYSGTLNHEGSEVWTTGVKDVVLTISTLNTPTNSSGTITTGFEAESGVSAGIEQQVEYTGENSRTTSTTITSRYQTSDDPLYVGANGDVFLGYSTNISFGSTLVTTVVARSTYDSIGADSYLNTYYLNDDVAFVETRSITLSDHFNTFFAYPQVFIEQNLLPNLADLRDGLILAPQDTTGMQARATSSQQPIYVSKVPVGDDDFGAADQYYAFLPPNKTDTIEALNQSIAGWEQALSDNDSVKVKANKLIQNYSFHAGSPIEYNEQYSTAIASVNSFNITVGVVIGNDFNYGTGPAQTKFTFEEHVNTTQGGSFESALEATHTRGFVLAEDGDDDYISVDVLHDNNYWRESDEEYEGSGAVNVGTGSATTGSLKEKTTYGGFVFRTKGGATGCPYEGATYATHWRGHTTELISQATMQLEKPQITVDRNFVENVPSGETAYFTLFLHNNSETGEDQWFNMMQDDQTNPDGAMISVDGNTLAGFRLEFLVPAGDNLQKTLAVEKGRALNYDNLGIVLMSQCQADPTSFLDVIADTVHVSVHFTPSCTDVNVAMPTDNWTYNTKCPVDTIEGSARRYMPVRLDGFDVNYTDFDHIELQYKAASASDNDWITLAYYFADDSLFNAYLANGFNALYINPADAGTINYKFYMDELPDQRYDIRAVSVCNINNTLYENPSPVVSGIKDVYNPRLFGQAKPANGILTVEDDIRLDFNEAIAEGLLTDNNFSVTGIRNGAATAHDVSIQLDGNSAYLSSELAKSYASKNLTIEGWINYDADQNACIFSHGDFSESLAFMITDQRFVRVRVGDREYVSARAAALEPGSWNHVALVLDAANGLLTAYVNWVAVLQEQYDSYKGTGVLEVGRDIASEAGYFCGKVDQFRVWNAVRSAGQLQVNSAIQLSGNDVGLIGYYAMDEAKGTATADKARGVNLIMHNAEWALPAGFASAFDGLDDYVALPSATTVCTAQMDYTLAFWMKADGPQTDAIILSNGDGISQAGESPLNLFSVGFNADGQLCYRNNGVETVVNGDWADNQWHHFAFTVSRASGHARIYMDGQLNTYLTADAVGGISSDFIFAGCRGYYDDIGHRTTDRFFRGSVDEIALWKLYRTQSQMEKSYNDKLAGDELGLLAYYPMEHYITFQGVQELQYTLKDYVSDTITGTAYGSARTADIAPVRTLGAVSKLRFDFVVNDDALIINLKEDAYRIENTIINFTVEDVRDVNGNSILSPITWSAYIDRNQLAWTEEDITLRIPQYAGAEFSVGITNKGGSVKNYSVKNMPQWLSVSPEAGYLNPTKSGSIAFSVDPGLQVGTYNEVIYLEDDENVAEPINLNVTVLGVEPEWGVDPGQFEYSMNIFGQLRFSGVLSSDVNDILAAFDGNRCVGTTKVQYNKSMDMYYILMTVYSNAQRSDRKLAFRMYDASTGVTYEGLPSEDITFSNNAVYGTALAPVIFSAADLRFSDIALREGWNWISFPLAGDRLGDLDAALSTAEWQSGEQVKNLNTFASYSANAAAWNTGGGLTGFDNTQMYMMKVNSDRILPTSGKEIDPLSAPITIRPNWNYIGYLPTQSLTVKAALAGYDAKVGDIIKSQDGFAMFVGNDWIGSLTYMKPTEGYMLQNTSTVQKTLTYPSTASLVNPAPAHHAPAKYAYNMSVFGYCPTLREGDLLYAVVDGEICGQAVEVDFDGTLLSCISVAGSQDSRTVSFILLRGRDTFVSTTVLPYEANAVHGSPAAPVEIAFAEGAEGAAAMVVFPNPADAELTVSAVIPAGEEAQVEIYDLVGKLIWTSEPAVTDGLYLRSIQVGKLQQGAYFLRLTHGQEACISKFIKM